MPGLIHFSIDDVLPSLKYFTEHQETINSLWELDFYKILRYWHEKYGLIVTLNLFDKARGFNINNVSILLKRDFMEAKNWLYMSFHGSEKEKEFYISDSIEKFVESYENVEKFSMYMQERSLSKTVRIHFFEAGEKQIKFLQEKGINTLLTADDNRNSYGLPVAICNKIRKNHNQLIDGINYIHTDLRIENIQDLESTIMNIIKKDKVVLFTHEWCLKRNIEIIENVFEILVKKYKYIFCKSI